MVIFTGCGVRINGKDYELFTVDKKEKSSILDAIGSESSEESTISEDRGDAEKLVLSVNSGNIEIEKSETTDIKIKADKKVKGASQSDKNTILKNMNIAIERVDKTLKIVVKTEDKKDFWDWLKENYKAFQVSINYEIWLPEGINAIDVTAGAGNIEIENISSELVIDNGVGNIDIQEFTAYGNTKISTGAGNIDFDGNLDNISSFEVSTGAGNIDFDVPEDTKMSLEANTGVGMLSGDFINKNSDNRFSFKGDINGGGPKVKISSGVGNVSVDND